MEVDNDSELLLIVCDWASCERVFRYVLDYELHLYNEHICPRFAALRRQRKISRLPPETWNGVLRCCGRESLALRVSLADRLLHAISRPLIDLAANKQRQLDWLCFRKAEPQPPDNEPKCSLIYGHGPVPHYLPIAKVAPPENVRSFERIHLTYFDSEVLDFFRAIRRLLTEIYLEIRRPMQAEDNLTVLRHLLHLIAPEAITALTIDSHVAKRMGVESFERLLANVKQLAYICFKEMQPDDAQMAVVLRWLFAPRPADGALKLAKFFCPEWHSLPPFLESFNGCEQPAGSFFEVVFLRPNFELPSGQQHYENARTGQRITLQAEQKPDQLHFVYVTVYCRMSPANEEEEAADAAKFEELKRLFGEHFYLQIPSDRTVRTVVLSLHEGVGDIGCAEVEEEQRPADAESDDLPGPSGFQ